MLVFDEHTRKLFPFLEKVFADGAYGGAKVREAMAGASWAIEVVKRPEGQKGFEVLPRRWVVERTPHPEPVEGRLDQPLPAPCQGLRKSQPNGAGFHPDGQHKDHDAPTYPLLLSFVNFPDRLLGRSQFQLGWAEVQMGNTVSR